LLYTFDVLLHDAFIHAHALHLQMVQYVDMTLISISSEFALSFLALLLVCLSRPVLLDLL